ncbi:MAG: NAD(P)/FAD-dependent oxidoreductase [Symploca sp. SIO2G7]|nr:NAD(P)/FAD-dependent oxidoreductase [Symploca sp. SIO2G7]
MVKNDTDYDLAILGGSLSSRLAACAAAQRGARVALIAPNWQESDVVESMLETLWASTLPVSTPYLPGTLSHTDVKERWSKLLIWQRYQRQHAALSPAILSSQGIDVILEPVKFTQQQTLKSEHRHLRASCYLLADGYRLLPFVTSCVLQCHRLPELEKIPSSVAVVGYGATAAEWAYALSRVTTVTLISSTRQLLPAEDQDIQRLGEAQLRSLGITIVVSENCSQPGEDILVTASKYADQVVVAPQTDTWDTIGLENLDIKLPVVVNRYLQTRCANIYAVGGGLGGENRAELTQQETAIVLNNALFKRRHVMRYDTVCYSINLLSPIGHWGLTERQARWRYGSRVELFQASSLPMDAVHAAQLNFCKLITVGPQLLGVHLMGKGASILAAALGKTTTIKTLSQWTLERFQSGTLQEAIYQASERWQNRHWREGSWRRDWAENWFNWRRSR